MHYRAYTHRVASSFNLSSNIMIRCNTSYMVRLAVRPKSVAITWSHNRYVTQVVDSLGRRGIRFVLYSNIGVETRVRIFPSPAEGTHWERTLSQWEGGGDGEQWVSVRIVVKENCGRSYRRVTGHNWARDWHGTDKHKSPSKYSRSHTPNRSLVL